MSLKLLTRDQHIKLKFIHSELQQVQTRGNFNCWAFVSQRSAGSEPVFVEYAILRQHLSLSVHVDQSLEDGVESYIDEFRIRFFGRVGQSGDLVSFTAIIHLLGS